MIGVTIVDADPVTGVLTFDLRDVLRALGPDALRSVWRLSGVECIGQEAAERLHTLSDEDAAVNGTELIALADEVVQVIDGQFAARLPGDEDDWVRIRAVDSSAYDVETDREDVVEVLRRRFRHVQRLG